MNSIRSRQRSQDFTKNPIPIKNILDNGFYFFNSWPPRKIRLLDYFLWHSNNNPHIYFNQTTAAEYAGISRKTANEWILEFEQLGLVHSVYRHMRSCYYKVSRWFANPEVRNPDSGIGLIFNSLRYQTIMRPMMLLSLLIAPFASKVTQEKCIKLTNIYYQSINQSHSVLTPESVTTEASLIDLDQKRNEMLGNEMIPAYVKAIKSLKLTKYGQACLSIFPQEVIQYADNLTLKFQPKSPYDYFEKVCINRCAELRIMPKRERFTKIVELYNLPQGTPKLLSNTQQEPSQQRESPRFENKPIVQPKQEHQQIYNKRDDFGLGDVLTKTRTEKSNDGRMTFSEWLQTEVGKKKMVDGSLKEFEQKVLGMEVSKFLGIKKGDDEDSNSGTTNTQSSTSEFRF